MRCPRTVGKRRMRGRWVLGDEPNLLSINLHAPLESGAHRICTMHSIESEAVGEQLATYCDERRTNFIKRIVGPLNPNHEDFDLCVNTGRMGIEPTVDVLLFAAEAFRYFGNPQRIDQEETLSCVGPAKGITPLPSPDAPNPFRAPNFGFWWPHPEEVPLLAPPGPTWSRPISRKD